MKKEKSQKGKRIALRIVSVLLAIVLVVMLGATVLADTILNNLNYVEKGQSESLSYEEALALKEQAQAATEEDEDDANLETLNEDDVNLDIEILGGIGLEKHIINVLLNFLFIYEPRTVILFGMNVRIWGAGLGITGAAAASAASLRSWFHSQQPR